MMQAVILAGGLATRQPAARTVPKFLLPVAGQPFAAWLLERLGETFDDVVICVGHQGDKIRDYVGDGESWGLRVRYSDDGPKPIGTGGALRKALPLLDDAFLVTYGDSFLPFNYWVPLVELAGETEADGVMAVYPWTGPERNVELRHDVRGRPRVDLYAKRSAPTGTHIDYGATALRREVVEVFPRVEPYRLDDALSDLSVVGKLRAHVADERFYEIGTPEGLAELENYLCS